MPKADQVTTLKSPHTPLRLRRVILGLSQQKVANAAGISRSAVGQLELGSYEPSPPVKEALARAIGCDVAAIFPD